MRWIGLRYQDSSPVESWRSGQAEWNKSILMWVASTENCLEYWSPDLLFNISIISCSKKPRRLEYHTSDCWPSVSWYTSQPFYQSHFYSCVRGYGSSPLDNFPGYRWIQPKRFTEATHSPKNNGKSNDSRWFQSHLCSIASLYKSWTLTDFWAPRKSPNFQTRALPSLHPHALILFLMKLGTIYLLDPSQSSPHSPFLILRGSSLWSTTLFQCVFKRHRARISVITPCYLPWMQGVRVMRAKMRN